MKQAAEGSIIIEASAVSKRFGARLAVDRLSLNVPSGVCYGLLGPNGAGKTTTLRMIYGVTRPDSGTVHVFGIDIGRAPRAVRSRLGVTLQHNALIDELTPEENLRVFGRYHLMREPDLSLRARELIEIFELSSHAKVPVRHLSGGFQRRLGIALSLMNRPELLILDEPTTGLDPAARLALWSRVRDFKAEGTTVLLTTHYMDEAQRLCDTVAIISEGKVIGEGEPLRLITARLARETVELDCPPAEEVSLLNGLSSAPQRLRVGRRLMLYHDDATFLIEHIRQLDGGHRRSLIVRPTNLEDVFLALTGARLEGQP
jgi:lipooligosaccharide transport system ATP-binding protein